MKECRDRIVYIGMLTGIFLCCFTSQSFAQEKINISAGFGFPELLNVGAKYQLSQKQIGLSVGSVPAKDESLISLTAEVYFHFAGTTELSARRPWYIRTGLNFFHDERQSVLDNYLYYNIRMGRDFNISEKLGIGVDAGAFFQLFRETIRDDVSNGWNIDFDFPVSPGFSVGLFYRI